LSLDGTSPTGPKCVLLDAGGVVVVRRRERLTRGVLYAPLIADDIIAPLLPIATTPH
jgi:hypothetical protein